MTEIMSRADGLDVHEVPDGYIVYQGTRDNVCYLNKTAAVIFELCYGKLEADDIVARVRTLYGLDVSSDSEIKGCLDSLVTEGLIKSSSK